MKSKTIHLTDIPKESRYTGYLWQSDQSSPMVFRGEALPAFGSGTNPFIIEGQLYNKDNDLSYSIKFVDGKYLVKEFDLKEPETFKPIEKCYLANRLDGVAMLCFKEYWQPEKDECCAGMDVLKPAALVFVGFNYKED